MSPDGLFLTVDGRQYILHGRYSCAIKRAFDIVGALFGLVLSAPLFGFIAILIKLDSRGPVFFQQTRVGLHRRRFKMWKFRKMPIDLRQQGPLLTRRFDLRLTRVGALLERTKLDELPQLINVLLGDMSLIGPRPEVQRFVDVYPEEWDAVLSVKPGIFGVNQILQRNESELYPPGCTDIEAYYISDVLPAKLKIDSSYARQTLLAKDCALLIGGVWVALSGVLTTQSILVRRWQILNLCVLSLIGIAGVAGFYVVLLHDRFLASREAMSAVLMAAVIKPVSLWAFRIARSMASSATVNDFTRIFWCAASSSALLTCALVAADVREVSRMLIIFDALFFLTVMFVYKLVLYKLYVTYVVHKARKLARDLILFAAITAPISMIFTLALRHNLHTVAPSQLRIYVSLAIFAAIIRPLIALLNPVSNNLNNADWILNESPKLLISTVVGSGLIVASNILLNDRDIGRLDVLLDAIVFAALTISFGLWRNIELVRRVPAGARGGNVVIVGSGVAMSAYVETLNAISDGSYTIFGVICPERSAMTNTVGGHPVIGCISDLPSILDTVVVARVILLRHSLSVSSLALVDEITASKDCECVHVDFDGTERPHSGRLTAAVALSMPAQTAHAVDVSVAV